jgi:hypothetical protein
MYDEGLAQRIRSKGVRVVEVAGWQTRGSPVYTPILGLWHHTAGAKTGTAPSLNVCIYGRAGLSGPLCQVLQSREPDGRDIAYVIAAGRANHAGAGEWLGISGNSNAAGLEVEHVGTSKQPAARHEISARILAALIEAPSGSRDARYICRHADYARPRGRKIDFFDPSPWSSALMRQRVAQWIGKSAETERKDWFDMATEKDLDRVVRKAILSYPQWVIVVEENPTGTSPVYFTNFAFKVELKRGNGHSHEYIKGLRALAGQAVEAVRVPKSVLDDIPTFSG